ncbi:hypothetical protein B0H66DRAFT_543476 [Apodospora peruviana]|uniref:Secreted protein n=1 Tax=Apodospora peruviana TaxID=516989 RepID=A0AAE0MF91_9PEZI|nr:hypothetical protein B0H66DRAFT_543476 [Apodospora peruviana]
MAWIKFSIACLRWVLIATHVTNSLVELVVVEFLTASPTGRATKPTENHPTIRSYPLFVDPVWCCQLTDVFTLIDDRIKCSLLSVRSTPSASLTGLNVKPSPTKPPPPKEEEELASDLLTYHLGEQSNPRTVVWLAWSEWLGKMLCRWQPPPKSTQ